MENGWKASKIKGMKMERLYRTATRKGGQNIYGEWTPDKEIVEREVALMLVNEPKTTSWLESQPESFVLRPSLDQIATT